MPAVQQWLVVTGIESICKGVWGGHRMLSPAATAETSASRPSSSICCLTDVATAFRSSCPSFSETRWLGNSKPSTPLGEAAIALSTTMSAMAKASAILAGSAIMDSSQFDGLREAAALAIFYGRAFGQEED